MGGVSGRVRPAGFMVRVVKVWMCVVKVSMERKDMLCGLISIAVWKPTFVSNRKG